MPDVLVTVPKSFGLQQWIDEGDLPGQKWSGEEWHFYLGGSPPNIKPGERVYVTYNGKLRGYSTLVRVERYSQYSYALVRHNDSKAITIDRPIQGFQGFRCVDWDRSEEKPFQDWMKP